MYLCFTRMLLVCTRVLLVCTRVLLVCTRMLFVCTRVLLVCTCVLLVCYSYVLVWCFSHDRLAVAIVINKLSHLSDRVCNSCWRRKVRNLFQLFHLVKNSTKESVQIVSFQTAITVFCFALSAKLCKSQSVSNKLTCNCLFTAKSAVFFSARTESTSTKI